MSARSSDGRLYFPVFVVETVIEMLSAERSMKAEAYVAYLPNVAEFVAVELLSLPAALWPEHQGFFLELRSFFPVCSRECQKDLAETLSSL